MKAGAETRKKKGLEAKAKRAAERDKDEANAINPLNVAADAIARYVSSGFNPLAAGSALINPVKGNEFKPLEVIPSGIASGLTAKALTPETLGPATAGPIEKAGQMISSMAKPDLATTATYLSGMQDRNKAIPALATLADIETKRNELARKKTSDELDNLSKEQAISKSKAEVKKIEKDTNIPKEKKNLNKYDKKNIHPVDYDKANELLTDASAMIKRDPNGEQTKSYIKERGKEITKAITYYKDNNDPDNQYFWIEKLEELGRLYTKSPNPNLYQLFGIERDE
jgi:hypothetical protein